MARRGPATWPSASRRAALEAWADELRRAGVAVERQVSWPAGGRSLYVRDPAGNSVELIEGEAWPALPDDWNSSG